jgi:hypothetical protein
LIVGNFVWVWARVLVGWLVGWLRALESLLLGVVVLYYYYANTIANADSSCYSYSIQYLQGTPVLWYISSAVGVQLVQFTRTRSPHVHTSKQKE